VLRDSPVSRMICRIERPCRSKTLISTACSWVNISTARKQPPSSPRGVKITSPGVGQFYFGDDKSPYKVHEGKNDTAASLEYLKAKQENPEPTRPLLSTPPVPAGEQASE
jgi:hypothetical protein